MVMNKVCVLFSVGPREERKVPRSGFRKLANQHLTTDVFGLAVGQPQFHDVHAGWVRCRLYHIDLEVNLRGQAAWKEHWHSAEQYARKF